MNETVNFEKQYEEKPDVIEIGNYVRIVESADVGEQQDMIYTQDIQAVGVVRDYFSDLSGSYVEFPRGVFGLTDDELYLVDVDALAGEMEEMLAEEAAEAEEKPEAIIAALRVTVDERKPLAERMTEQLGSAVEWTGNMCSLLDIPLNNDDGKPFRLSTLLSEIRQAINEIADERDSLLARNRLLEEKLRPFALAAEFDYDVQHSAANKSLRISSKQGHIDSILIGASGTLQVKHLREALEALPDVKAGSTNAGGGSQ